MKKYFIYTDGACSGNPGRGGLGYVVFDSLTNKKSVDEFSSFEEMTTNNIMELRAVIEALKKYKDKGNLTMFVDSKYVKDGITDWIHVWKKLNWNKKDKKPIKNLELWKELDELVNSSIEEIDFKWVRAHSGDYGNEYADRLATDAIANSRSTN